MKYAPRGAETVKFGLIGRSRVGDATTTEAA